MIRTILTRLRARPVFEAVERGSAADVERLLEATPEVVNTRRKGLTLLHMATLHGDSQLVELLLEKGADANGTDRSGKTPLHFAALTGNRQLAELLIDSGADVNARDKQGNAPLVLAVPSLAAMWLLPEDRFLAPLRAGRLPVPLEVAEVLVDRGADHEAKNQALAAVASVWKLVDPFADPLRSSTPVKPGPTAALKSAIDFLRQHAVRE